MLKKLFCIFSGLFLLLSAGCQCSDDKITQNKNSVLSVLAKSSSGEDFFLIREEGCAIVVNCSQKENIKATVEFLKKENVQKIDYLILTDFSDDNLNGASVFLRKLNVVNIIEPSYIPKNSEFYKKYKETLKFKNITPLSVKKDETISIGNIILDFFGCDNSYYKNDPQNCSLVFKLTHFDNSFLFSGSIKEERMLEITEKSICTDFIKISAKTNYSTALKKFIKKSEPSYCYITSSEKKPANSKTRNFLKKKNIGLYFGFENDYTFISDGITINVRKE